jgi:hypothetical protein
MALHSRANYLPVRAARRQLIEGFIDYLPISMRGLLGPLEDFCTQRPLRARGSLSRRQDVQGYGVLPEDR